MFDLTDSQESLFHEQGFLFVEGLLAAAAIETLRHSFDRLFIGQFETGVAPDEVNWQEGKSDPTLTRQICNGWKADRSVAATVLRADLGRALARLAGWPGTRIMHDNLIWKPPGAKSLGFHQDNAYLEWFDRQEICTCWIALDETRAEAGTMELVRGSHRWARHKPEGEFHAPADYQAPMRRAAALEGAEPVIVPVAVPAGGGSFHHGWTWHGSGPNGSATLPRRALVIHAMSSDCRFSADPARLQQGNGPVYSRYKRLDSLEMDESHFPITWREDGYRSPGLEAFCRQAA
jgi:hypothetical protein